MNSFPTDPETVLSEIANIGGSLNLELLDKIMSIIPKDDEYVKMKNYSGNIDTLVKPEKFLKRLIDIPRIKERMQCLSFKQNF